MASGFFNLLTCVIASSLLDDTQLAPLGSWLRPPAAGGTAGLAKYAWCLGCRWCCHHPATDHVRLVKFRARIDPYTWLVVFKHPHRSIVFKLVGSCGDDRIDTLGCIITNPGSGPPALPPSTHGTSAGVFGTGCSLPWPSRPGCCTVPQRSRPCTGHGARAVAGSMAVSTPGCFHSPVDVQKYVRQHENLKCLYFAYLNHV